LINNVAQSTENAINYFYAPKQAIAGGNVNYAVSSVKVRIPAANEVGERYVEGNVELIHIVNGGVSHGHT
jgi:hypothetical protein